MTYNDWLELHGFERKPEKHERMAKEVFSLFCASGLTAYEVELTISELGKLYEERKTQDRNRPLMEINKEYVAERKDISADPDYCGNVLDYVVLQKLETMHQVAVGNQTKLECLQRRFLNKRHGGVPIFGGISPLAISIAALVVSVVATVIKIVC